MKNIFLPVLCMLSYFVHADSWTQKADLPGDDRGASAGFSINGKGYIGTGIKFAAPVPFHDDFWEYDPATNVWTQKADFGGAGRCGAVGFSVSDKGYIACGSDGNGVQQDIWEYDPVLNSWLQKAGLPGPGRNYTVAFVIDSIAYLGTGYDAMSSSYQDLWEFNPASNVWTAKANVGGGVRSSAMAFSVGSKGYIGGGYSATYMDDFWEYDPASNAWTQKANIPGGGRSDGAAFAIGDYGYILTGQLSTQTAKDVQQYNPLTNTWTQKLNLTGSARSCAVAFSAGSKGYISTGYDPVFVTQRDLWEYSPDSISTTGINNLSAENDFKIFPNPADDELQVQYGHGKFFNSTIIFSDVKGKTVLTYFLNSFSGSEKINVADLRNGVYFYKIVREEKNLETGKILIRH